MLSDHYNKSAELSYVQHLVLQEYPYMVYGIVASQLKTKMQEPDCQSLNRSFVMYELYNLE